MQTIDTNNSASVLGSSAAMGVATRDITSAGVDVTLDAEAGAADILVLTGVVSVGAININIPRGVGLQPLDTASSAASAAQGYGRRLIVRMNQTGAFANTIRGVDLTNPSVPVYGASVTLPVPAATPNIEIYTLDGLTYYKASVAAA